MTMQVIDPKEFVLVTFWEDLCNQLGVKFCPQEHLADYLRTDIQPNTVFVSGFSDYSVGEQEKQHPNADLIKHVEGINWQLISQQRAGYVQKVVGPTVSNDCHHLDKYSVKVEHFTIATFQELHSNIKHWFTTNLNTKEFGDRATLIPFGVNDERRGESEGWMQIKDFQHEQKTGLLYLNFQNHSVERVRLKQHYQSSYATVAPAANLPVRDFLQSIARHKFTLCPSGMGLDCYRVYESIYLGSIPILKRCDFAEMLQAYNLPILVVDNLFDISPQFLEIVWDQFQEREWDYRAVTKSYWKKVITEAVA